MVDNDIEDAFLQGVAMVGFSRQFIRDPDFLNNGYMNKCVQCNYCIGTLIKKDNLFECIYDRNARLKAEKAKDEKIEDYKVDTVI